jgi:hypothetical protein
MLRTTHVGVVAIAILFTISARAAATKAELVHSGDGWQLLRAGKPYFIKGVGGSAPKAPLPQLGANSFRTWGADDLNEQLDEAQRLGLTVTVGIWLEHERKGFNYSDPQQVAQQREKVKQAILRYKDHPAVLLWGLGNEMEGYKEGADPHIWAAVNDLAVMAKQLDPNHPTMTCIAEVGGERVPSIHKLCPAIDIIGINSYGGITSIPDRYRKAGGTKPYIVTEFGPAGFWEVGKNAFGALVEATSTQKAAMYRRAYESAIAPKRRSLCLGSYAFTWGAKQEATATWFGMLLPDNTQLGAVETLSELWTGKPVANHCPVIEPIELSAGDALPPGATFTATVPAKDPDGDALQITWQLHRDAEKLGEGGDYEPPTKRFADAIVNASDNHANIRLPEGEGTYRLYAFARDGKGNGAVANVPIIIRRGATLRPPAQPTTAAVAPTTKAQLPLVIHGDGSPDSGYAPSGWMGNTQAIKLDEKCATQPHSGPTCIKVQYTGTGNWAGVAWQSPAGDWGNEPGGQDLSGATKLTWWARGEKGGEKVEFKFGILGPDKKFSDTASGSTTVELTRDWKPYTIDLAGKDLSRIKTPFCWVIAGRSEPITFYIDDLRFE